MNGPNIGTPPDSCPEGTPIHLQSSGYHDDGSPVIFSDCYLDGQ